MDARIQAELCLNWISCDPGKGRKGLVEHFLSTVKDPGCTLQSLRDSGKGREKGREGGVRRENKEGF